MSNLKADEKAINFELLIFSKSFPLMKEDIGLNSMMDLSEKNHHFTLITDAFCISVLADIFIRVFIIAYFSKVFFIYASCLLYTFYL